MSTFVWDNIAVTVREMSRTAALECSRNFDMIAPLYGNVNELMRETDVLFVIYAPVSIRTMDGVFTSGEHVIKLEDGSELKITLPITRDAFYALPMSLTEAWVSAAVTSNEWFVNTLKKILKPIQTTSESKSDSVPSSELEQASTPTTTIGV